MDRESKFEKKFYTKSELEEFRNLLLEKMDEAKAEYKRLSESLKAFSGITADSYNFTEFGNESSEKEQIEILMSRQDKFLISLEKALIRIENGTYGVCRITGKLIPKERLRLVPHATTTVEGKLKQQVQNIEN